jgi:hypothetical protein
MCEKEEEGGLESETIKYICRGREKIPGFEIRQDITTKKGKMKVVNDKEVLKKGRMMEGVFCGGINGERKRRMKGNLFYFPASTFSLVNLVSSDIFFLCES